jgi:hypothetical protein
MIVIIDMRFLIVLLLSIIFLGKLSLSAEIIRVFWENDVVVKGSDHYYTNGFRIEYWNRSISHPLPYLGRRYFSYPHNCDREIGGLSFGQNQYTPTEIERNFPKEGDRNYAAWLYLGSLYSLECGKHSFFWESSIGSLGRISGGEPIQSIVHKAIQSARPEGWGDQIKNSITFQNNLDYKYFYNPYIGLHSFGKLGNAFSAMGGGLITRIGRVKSNTMPGMDISGSSQPAQFMDRGEFYFYIQAQVWKQFYDGTIQGGDPWKEKEKWQITEDRQNSFLLNNQLEPWRARLGWDWNQEETLLARFGIFYELYKEKLPDNLPMNLLLFHTLFNGNSLLDKSEKRLIAFLLKDKPWEQATNDEKLIYAISLTNNTDKQISDLTYLLTFKYFIETISKDFPLSMEQQILLWKYQKEPRVPVGIEPRSMQGKIQMGFAMYLRENLFFHVGGVFATTDFYPDKNLPQSHKWGSIQLAYNY